jgi:tetratricopeptide (TPR) repeat protein
MREKVYEKLSRAQEATEAGDWEKAYDQLVKLEKMNDLASHEKAQLYTAYGYTYFSQEKYVESAAAYEQVLQQDELAEAMRISTLYTLGQLHFHLEHFDVAVEHLENWLQLADNPGPEPFILMAQALYQLDRLDEVADPVRRAIAVAEQRDQKVQENWYALLRVVYFETQDYENLLGILEILVTRYPAKEYWIHLASAFGEMNDAKRQLAAYEAAYEQGYLTGSSEIVLLCQLLLQAEVPYRAGVLLQENLDGGVVESNANNWRLLSQAWILAQEHDAAIASLGKAAELSDDGELYARIAQSYANLNRWESSADAAATALERGVKNPQELQMMRGMAYFELGRFTESKAAFAEAQKTERGRQTASRWLAYVEREEKRLRELGINP